jgi:hypothetical protein
MGAHLDQDEVSDDAKELFLIAHQEGAGSSYLVAESMAEAVDQIDNLISCGIAFDTTIRKVVVVEKLKVKATLARISK